MGSGYDHDGTLYDRSAEIFFDIDDLQNTTGTDDPAVRTSKNR